MRTLAAVAIAATALAEPTGVRLSFVGDPATSIAVAWNTGADTATSTVWWGTEPGVLTEVAMGASFEAPSPLGFIHEVLVLDLPPDTPIYFQAGDATDGWSDEQSFRTAPEGDENCGSFRFVVVGDSRSNDDGGPSENWSSIAIESAAEEPAFLIFTGDQVRDGSDARQWWNWLLGTEPILGLGAAMPTIGNHDDGPGEGDGAYYNQVFQLPRALESDGGSGTEDYHYFTFGNAIFVCLSTMTYEGGATPFADQAAWLDAVLAKTRRLWKFVYFHHPVYTGDLPLGVNHPPDEQDQNAALVPVLDAHHVDIVFQGHNHWYERFDPSACGDGSDEPCPTEDFATGTVYVTSGGAGAFTYDIPGACTLSDVDGRATCDGRHHYLKIDVDGGTLDMEVWATSAQNFGEDPDNHELIETLTITKPEYDPSACAGEGESEGEAEGEPESDGEPEGEGEAEGDGEAEGGAASGASGGGCGCALGARV